jgi:arginine decarboxylase
MIIPVTSAVGRGPTELAAFDSALVAAGVADRNLIYLSSVLPPASAVRLVDRIDGTPGSWGDRLYCVMAQTRTTVPGDQAWAGIGWAQDRSGRGLLVEHHAHDEASLRELVSSSLDGLCRNRGIDLPSRGILVTGAHCTDEPICALVVAVFEAAAWSSAGRPATRPADRPVRRPAPRARRAANPARWRM